MSKEMRQHIDNFRNFLTENSKKKLNISDVRSSEINEMYLEKMLNEGLFNGKFLIIYQITNFKAIANLDYMNKYQGSQKVSEWKSPIYSYIQKAKTPDEARNLFENKWNELANYEPKPKLEILSVQEIGEISDKIHTY